MKKTEASLDIETVPLTIRQHLLGAAIYDSSCSAQARTLFVRGTESAYLKISPRGTLEREYRMTAFLHGHKVAPNMIAYESDERYDYLLSEAVPGEDGSEGVHVADPDKLARVFGEYLNMLHSIPTEGCPYKHRTAEMLDEVRSKGIDLTSLDSLNYSAQDDVLIHGDYCLPNIIMDHFAFKGFIDVGSGGIGDRHYDIYWGLWTLNYNLKTDRYQDSFLDAYGRGNISEGGLAYFTVLESLTSLKQ